MYYRFSVDDNIRFLKDINSNNYSSIFENPYLGFFKSLHLKYGARFQFNLYYETEGFDLSEMTDRYRDEWRENADWLRLSFHGQLDIGEPPYLSASYEKAFDDCNRVHKEILRFAGEESLSYFTTIHYCQGSPEALRAFYDCGIRGLVGLFSNGTKCYQHSYPDFTEPYKYEDSDGIYYFVNDMIINLFGLGGVEPYLEGLSHKEFLEVMIHEQYFYKDYPYHQPDFCEKVERVVKHLTESGRKSVFLEELLER